MPNTPETVPTPKTTLGGRVRSARHARQMSQAQLAGEELTKGFISQIEAGLVRPSVRSLQIIAGRLGRSLDYLLGDEPLASAKRLTFHRLAAEAAAERRDWDEVREEVAAALQLEPEPLERARLLRVVAAAEVATGNTEAAFDHIDKALGLVDPTVDALEVARLLDVRGAAYLDHGQLVASLEALEAARDVIERYELTDPRLRARNLVSLGTAYRRLNRTTKAMQAYESALALASRTSELRLAAQGYMGIAVSHYDAGELDDALTNYQRALDLFGRAEDVGFELSVLQSLAAVQFEQGDIEAARAFAQRCIDRAGAVGDVRLAAVAEVTLARIALVEGRNHEALRIARRSEKVFAAAGDARRQADAMRVVGATQEALGAHAAADRAYRKAIELARSVGNLPDLSAFAAEYAQKLRARGDLDAAFAMLELARGSNSRG